MSNDECHTPDEFFDKLNKVFKFKLDAAATAKNTKCKRFITKEQDAFKIPWKTKGWVWCNPPYSREGGGILNWLHRAYETNQEGQNKGVCALIICDVSTQAFTFAWDYANEICLLTPRINFASPGKNNRGGGLQSYMLVFFRTHPSCSAVTRWAWKDMEFSERWKNEKNNSGL